MALGLTGLASGVDTDTIIAQLMGLERRSQTRLELQDLKARARLDALKELGSRLRRVDSAATDLRSSLTWDRQTL